MLYEDNSPLHDILWWIRYFRSTFSIDRVNIFADVSIFANSWVRKTLHFIYKLIQQNSLVKQILFN